MTDSNMANGKPLTGRTVFLIFAGAFACIIGVNLLLAYNAIVTFPGLEVKNSYVASQSFDKRRKAQSALGWSVRAESQGDEVVLKITDKAGAPVQVASLEATVGRATHVRDDIKPDFHFDGQAYVAKATLAKGNWNIRMKATDVTGTEFEQRVILHVTE